MPTPTQAYVVEEKGGPFVLMDVVLDDPLDDEVLVEMVASGICHTDFSVAKGLLPGASYPVILGHEGAARVLSTGRNVSSVTPGDAVLLSFAYCKNCENCQSKEPYACDKWGMLNFGKVRSNGSVEVGTLSDGRRVHGAFFGQSSFGKHSIVKESSCTKVPKDSDLKTLAPLGCGMLTGSGAIFNTVKPTPDQTIMISGLGGVGMAALYAASSLGVKTIIAVDLVESRLDMAKACGASHVVNAREVDTIQEIKRLTNGRGVDYVIEATGVVRASRTAYDCLAMKGMQIQIGDAGIGELSIPLASFLNPVRGIRGVVMGNSNPAELIPKLVEMYSQGKFPMDKISKQYGYTEFATAEAAMHSGETIKGIIVYEH